MVIFMSTCLSSPAATVGLVPVVISQCSVCHCRSDCLVLFLRASRPTCEIQKRGDNIMEDKFSSWHFIVLKVIRSSGLKVRSNVHVESEKGV